MRKYIIASHGRFAEGIYESAVMIIGKQDNVQILNCYTDGTDTKLLIENAMALISDEDEVVVVTDIFGGSVNNEFMKYLGRPNFHLIAGMNLPLLIQLFLSQNENTEEMIKEILSDGGANPKYCNEIQESVRYAKKDDDF